MEARRSGSLPSSWIIVGMLIVATLLALPTPSRPPAPQVVPADPLDNDTLQRSPPFEPALVDARPATLDGVGTCQINASAAVIMVDVPADCASHDGELQVLHPSYAAAISALRKHDNPVLPSLDMIDGKAKQFDDGLVAALDVHTLQAADGEGAFVRRLAEMPGKAQSFLAAGMALAGESRPGIDTTVWQAPFEADEVSNRPVAFYSWNEALQKSFRFQRFFQHEFDLTDLAVPGTIARMLASHPPLLARYRRLLQIRAGLHARATCLSILDLVDRPDIDTATLRRMCAARGLDTSIALFPPSRLSGRATTSALIDAIRSGEIDLTPPANAGWYDYQLFALEPLIVDARARERDKVLKTATYKRRLSSAFQALVAKRRDTHAENRNIGTALADPAPERAVRLRVEPCPTHYLRTARSYAFLYEFLTATVGRDELRQLHGLTDHGLRPRDLDAELRAMRDLHYGIYLVSCEDIGLAPAFLKNEPVDVPHCYEMASDWLAAPLDDPDMYADTRVAVVSDASQNGARLWLTLGVRLARMKASYWIPPRGRVANYPDAWFPVLEAAMSEWFIAVDESAEVVLPGRRVLTRDELRRVCDAQPTKEAMLAALHGKQDMARILRQTAVALMGTILLLLGLQRRWR